MPCHTGLSCNKTYRLFIIENSFKGDLCEVRIYTAVSLFSPSGQPRGISASFHSPLLYFTVLSLVRKLGSYFVAVGLFSQKNGKLM